MALSNHHHKIVSLVPGESSVENLILFSEFYKFALGFRFEQGLVCLCLMYVFFIHNVYALKQRAISIKNKHTLPWISFQVLNVKHDFTIKYAMWEFWQFNNWFTNLSNKSFLLKLSITRALYKWILLLQINIARKQSKLSLGKTDKILWAVVENTLSGSIKRVNYVENYRLNMVNNSYVLIKHVGFFRKSNLSLLQRIYSWWHWIHLLK